MYATCTTCGHVVLLSGDPPLPIRDRAGKLHHFACYEFTRSAEAESFRQRTSAGTGNDLYDGE